jgi:hypothetical protein
MNLRRTLLTLLTLSASPVFADEGMWPIDNFPTQAIRQAYGADISAAWRNHVQLATIRLTGCTASFVSPEGLILTNHHCVEACLADLSSATQSVDRDGFAAADRAGERKCETQVADVLIGTEEVTDKVKAATKHLSDIAANVAGKQTLTALEAACETASAASTSGPLKCESVVLYHGGQYFLYKYKHYDDVRLVFAPESAIAAFGGDPDNFQFPRWCLDFSVLRAYENGKPAHTPNFLAIDFKGPREKQLVFVSGHPGSTERLETRAQLELERDVLIPQPLLRTAELRGRYIQFGKTSDAASRLIEAPLNTLENDIKVRRKLLDGLNDDALLERKSKEERELRAKHVVGNTDPWLDIAKATQVQREIYLPYTYLERGVGFNSALFRYARQLVRGTAEREKPNAERLREYVDHALPALEQTLFAATPVHPELDSLTLAFSLERMREWLGPDDPTVRAVFGKDSVDSLTARLIGTSRLADATYRRQLWEGGKSAVDAASDPMLVLAREVEDASRRVRKRYEDLVEAPILTATERLADARFKAYGTHVYPDANFTLRFNYGTVQGWVENGAAVAPVTTLEAAFERATGEAPFKIPESWLKVRAQLDMHTPFNLSTNNDIVGGNSGSALIDVQGRIVGLLFDGNIHSIAGDYGFDATKNRAIAVHPAIIKLSLEQVYHQQALLNELQGK